MDIHVLVIIVVAIIIYLLIGRSRGDLPQPTSVEPWVIEAFRKKKCQQWLLGIPVGLVAFFLLWLRAHPSIGAGLEVV